MKPVRQPTERPPRPSRPPVALAESIEAVPTIDHADALEDLAEMPGYMMPAHAAGVPQNGRLSCSFCGVGDGGVSDRVPEQSDPADGPIHEVLAQSPLRFWTTIDGEPRAFEAVAVEGGLLRVVCDAALVPPGGVVQGEVEGGGRRIAFVGREIDRVRGEDGAFVAHVLRRFTGALTVFREVMRDMRPTTGCIKLRHSMVRQRVAYPIHIAPSVLGPDGKRRPISYDEAIRRMTDLILAHRPPAGNTLVYASGQCDYFAVFAMQEVFRLLGIRSLTGNAEHCLNAGAVHAEMLTGQEGPFLTIRQAVEGPNRFYLFNGWNGFVAHPPVFKQLTSRPDFDAYLIEVMVTESAKAVADAIGKERVLLIRPGSDPHLALGVAHEVLTQYPEAVCRPFVERFSDPQTFAAYSALARSETYAPERVAERIAPEPEYVERLLNGIRRMAMKMAQPGVVPINIPSVGLSQTSGAVAHCLWGSLLGMLGKYGLNADSTPAGGTLRLPGQINAESEVQGMSRKYFMGRVLMADANDAARRMGLPENAYDPVVRSSGRAALDYSDPTPDVRELFLCFGTQFEANMMGRPRWIEKLRDPKNTFVVVDPVPDPFTEKYAALILPSPPHPAVAKLYQNGEWKLTLSNPQKKAAPETRSDATIIYDVMAEVTRCVERDPAAAAAHPDLTRHARAGYLARRFLSPEQGGGLTRIDGEVSRPELWDRIQEYMSGGRAPLYCRPEHADGRLVTWTELVERGSLYYGGIGTTRLRLDYDDPAATPFRDIFRRPSRFRFFLPTETDLRIPTGTIFNSGRSTLSDDRKKIAFAIGTFNSGKATPIVGMPDDNPLFVSPSLAKKRGIETGDKVRVRNPNTGASIVLPAIVSDRVKGETVYASFHKSRAQMERDVYVNDVTSHEGRCAYTGQCNVKATAIVVERVVEEKRVADSETRIRRADPTHIDPRIDIPLWGGRDTALYVKDIIEETHDVYTFRLQGEPLCRFAYWPGQFCTLVLQIAGKKVLRSYSISSTPSRPYVLEVTVKRVPGGLVSNWLPDNLRIGDRLEVMGPKGKFCLMPGQVPPKVLFLGAGSGITPLMSMARWLVDVSADTDVKFFNSVRSPNDIVFHRELEMLSSRHRTFEPVLMTSSRASGHGWTGLRGRISRPMLELMAPDFADRHVYICGPEGFMDASRQLLEQMGCEPAKVHMESFAGARSAAGEGHGDADAAAAGEVVVDFAKTGRKLQGHRKQPLLDLAESNDIELDYGCRGGSCGDCKVRVLSGEVAPGGDSALTPLERESGWVLSCVATPKSDCVIDA